MKITIDTDKFNWIEVPGKPLLGSFLATMQSAHSHGGAERYPEGAALPRPNEFLLVKYESSWQTQTGCGLVPHDRCTNVDLVMFPRDASVFHGGDQQIVAYCNDLGRAIMEAIQAFSNAGSSSSWQKVIV